MPTFEMIRDLIEAYLAGGLSMYVYNNWSTVKTAATTVATDVKTAV